MEEGDKIEQLPNLELAQWKFLLTLDDSVVPNKNEIATKLMDVVRKENTNLEAEMKKANEEKLKQLEANLKDAIENLGEGEVRDAMQAKADFFARIGDKENADKEYRATEAQTVGSGQKLDVVFTQIRLGLFFMDYDMIKRYIEKAKSMVEAGSDWDRKNRLKVYEAMYLMSIRQFKKAAVLLLETISTFTAIELLDYQTYIYYTVLMAVVSMDRVTLKEKVINAPEILAVIDNIPHLNSLLNSIYNCQYAPFFVALAGITDNLKTNRLLHAHAGYYCKEMRIIAYSQLLESYRSVQLESMANAFGVTVEFLDRELSRFIASERIHCKIDKVAGIVETNRPDSRNAQYQAVIKQGDELLNRVQKLSRVINL